MSIILFILFIYILYLLLRLAFKVWRTYRKMKTGSFDIFGDLFGQPGGQRHTSQYEADGSRKGGWTKPRSKKKKISEDVGEYVKFSEITISETESHRQAGAERNSTTITEQQVVDVEWEDLPDK